MKRIMNGLVRNYVRMREVSEGQGYVEYILIIAFVVFLLVKMVNRVKDMAAKKEAPAPEAPKGPSELDVLMEIRDSLKAR